MKKKFSARLSALSFCRPMAIAAIVIMAGMLQLVSAYTVTKKDSVSDGLIFTMSDNSKMKVQVCTDKIIRIVYTAKATIPRADSNYIVVKSTWAPVPWTSSSTATTYSITTASLRVDVAVATGAVSYYTASGASIVQETAGKTLTQTTISGQTAYAGAINFNAVANEGIYGFGQFQNNLFNQSGQTLTLIQQNTMDCSPVFLSTRGFGILWINYSKMIFSPPISLTCDWATNDAIDYYFMYGPAFDDIIASYRTITGPAVMWPKWAYGFWQCKNAYANAAELISVVGEYRSKHYPIDNIVQDWQYYPTNGNGCECFDPNRYPDMKGTIQTLHDSLNCHLTISVWPSYNPQSGANYNFMNSHGYLLNVSDALGVSYDAFNDSAAFYYWKFINDSLVTKNIDGFWPDATEPEDGGWPTCFTAQGPSAKVLNIFPLLHSRTLYNGYRSANHDMKRVCNLTRSYYAGSQRLGAAYWTGDIDVSFPTYVTQIPAGLNFCMTGMPLFCTDVGGFLGVQPDAECEIRWFEWGAFNSVFRVHGTRPLGNENAVWSWDAINPNSEAILVDYLRLRYRLFPYVYSLAWKVTNEGYTIMRGLPFDFPNDVNVRNNGHEFMFGPSLLICPVTTEGVSTIPVYLPSGTWYNFWTGTDTVVATGTQITARAPLDTMPIFVRAGSILPMGPQITYADTAADPIELRVYTGADASFNLYEDEGDNYHYENGVYATIPITWNEAGQNLTIGARQGSFPGMLTTRTFNVVWVSPNHGVSEPVSVSIDKSISYSGSPVTLNKTSGQLAVRARPGIPAGVSLSMKLLRRKFIVNLTGSDAWQIRLVNSLGKVIVDKKLNGAATYVVADKLTSGVYFAQSFHGKDLINKQTVTVP
jgi:alpha-D-xyloside xylohydrolase